MKGFPVRHIGAERIELWNVNMEVGKPWKAPDYRQYKIDGIKELEWTRDSLAKKGLKDPWLRNHVWRYQTWPGYYQGFKNIFGVGFKYGLGLFVLTISADMLLGITAKKSDH